MTQKRHQAAGEVSFGEQDLCPILRNDNGKVNILLLVLLGFVINQLSYELRHDHVRDCNVYRLCAPV